MLLLDVTLLKNPVAQDSHSGCVVAVPAIFVYLPGGHLVCAAQESVAVLLVDVDALNNPAAHASHWGWALALPMTLV